MADFESIPIDPEDVPFDMLVELPQADGSTIDYLLTIRLNEVDEADGNEFYTLTISTSDGTPLWAGPINYGRVIIDAVVEGLTTTRNLFAVELADIFSDVVRVVKVQPDTLGDTVQVFLV